MPFFQDQKKERERLRAEIARDKEIRKLNQGVIPSVLGVDGYNPSAIQYDASGPPIPPSATPSASLSSNTTAQKATLSEPVTKKPTLSIATKPGPVVVVDPEKKISLAIQLILKYRTGGDGGNALKLLVTFLKNIVENPEEQKFVTSIFLLLHNASQSNFCFVYFP